MNESNISPTINKAKYLAGNFLAIKKLPSSIQSLKDAWRIFHGVSPYWAAWHLIALRNGNNLEELIGRNDISPLATIGLSVQERIREIIPFLDNSSLLCDEALWNFPKAANITALHIGIPPLGENSLRLINEYSSYRKENF